MADKKPSTPSYNLLKGIDQKSSDYSVEKAYFLDLRNVDFQVPNALQLRPGSTQAVTVGTSGPIRSLFEFEKLSGESYIVAGSDTAIFLLQSNAFTLIASGWNNGQPPDMLAFVNKLWMANGQKFESWNGTSAMPAGLPCSRTTVFTSQNRAGVSSFFGISAFLVAGATHSTISASMSPRAVFFAYSFVRADGYQGPADFALNARNVIRTDRSVSLGEEWFRSPSITAWVGGFTMPSGYAISAIALWIAVDTITPDSPTELIPNVGNVKVGSLGWLTGADNGASFFYYVSATLKPTADLARFQLFTLYPGASLEPTQQSDVNGGATYWAARLVMGATSAVIGVTGTVFNSFTGVPASTSAFSGMPFCFFDTNTPKYIEVNQNVMLAAGFSANPSVIWPSLLGEPEKFEPDGAIEVRTNDGDRVMATKAYNNYWVVMKERSFHKLLGDNVDNYQLVELSTQYGCISNKSVVEFREKLVWLDRQGVLSFNGSTWDIISTPVEDIFRRMNLSAAKEYACAFHYQFRNQVWFGIPVDGSTQNNLTVVYDYLVGAWTFFDGFNPSSFALMKGSLATPTGWRGDYSGMVFRHSESFYGDNGQGITALGFTPFDKNEPNETWIWRRLFLDVNTVSGVTGVINCEVFSNYDRSTVQATFTIHQNQFQSRAEMGVPAKAAAFQFSRHSASLPLLINGYTWTKRFLRNV